MMINVHRKRNVGQVLKNERKVFMIKHKQIQALIREWVNKTTSLLTGTNLQRDKH